MKPFKLCDAHAHPGGGEELLEREEQQIVTLLCVSTPAQAETIIRYVKGKSTRFPTALVPTAGLHPWHADQYKISDTLPFLQRCPVIGEIGMDSVWCNTPLDIQEQVFREQLALACRLRKPVILHTKGQEKKIASIIKEYPNTYLVHWYSCESFLEDYIALDCYFSIGPDVWWNPAVRRVAETVPLHRLLIETDGMSAVKWAYEEAPDVFSPLARETSARTGELSARTGEPAARIASPASGAESTVKWPLNSSEKTPPASVAAALTRTLAETAKIRRLSTEDAGFQVYQNLVHGFLEENLLPGM